MANQAQMLITWTPSPDATSQQVLRSTSNSGPWTTLITLSASSSSYTDTTVDPTPFTTYYYKIKTICVDTTIDTPIESDVCQNCPTSGNSFIFGARNLDSNPVDVEYTSGTNKWINSNYSTSLPTTKSTIVNNPPSSVDKLLFCAECSKDINLSYASIEGYTPPGTPSNSDFSYMEQQGHLASHLPTPPTALGGSSNFNLGTVVRKLESPGQFAAPSSGRFQLGIGTPNSNTFVPWNGGYVSANTNSGQTYNLPSSYRWNFGEMPNNNGTNQGGFTQIKIDKGIFNASDATVSGDQSTALEALTGSNIYMSIIDTAYVGSGTNGQSAYYNGHLRCEHYLYKLTRKSTYDTTNSTGFTMTRYSNVQSGGYAIFDGAITHQRQFLPYPFNDQPTVYLKIFTL